MLTICVARFGVPTLVAAFVLSAAAPSSAQSTYEPVTVGRVEQMAVR